MFSRSFLAGLIAGGLSLSAPALAQDWGEPVPPPVEQAVSAYNWTADMRAMSSLTVANACGIVSAELAQRAQYSLVADMANKAALPSDESPFQDRELQAAVVIAHDNGLKRGTSEHCKEIWADDAKVKAIQNLFQAVANGGRL